MNFPMRGILLLLAGLGLVIVSISQASAGFYRKNFSRQNADGYVIARSEHGHGSIRGRVRPTRKGPQVQLPGGNWIYCEFTCTRTLRVKTIDIWENMGSESDGIGYLRYERDY